jgi:hypothetical protein
LTQSELELSDSDCEEDLCLPNQSIPVHTQRLKKLTVVYSLTCLSYSSSTKETNEMEKGKVSMIL